MAFAAAMEHDYDYYLWLNDDTVLNENALQVLLDSSSGVREQIGKDAIIVGSCHDHKTHVHSYGGVLRDGTIVKPDDFLQPCDTMNGNIVLVPRAVSNALGNISTEFAHYFGDFDYGLRAMKVGFSVWIAPGYQGVCSRDNDSCKPWYDPQIPLCERLRCLYGPKGMPPREYYLFAKQRNTFLWPISMAKLYFRVLFPRVYACIKRLQAPRTVELCDSHQTTISKGKH